jgi:rubrerythrin
MTLTKSNDPKVLVGFINCLSVMEENAFLLYKALSDRIDLPLLKSLLLSIAEDSHKHSLLLKGVVDSRQPKKNQKTARKKPAKHGP